MRTVTSIVLLGALTSPAFATENTWTGHVSYYSGIKSLYSDDWKGYDNDQDSLGFVGDFKKQNWPVSIAIDGLASAKETTKEGIKKRGSTSELDIGVRKIWTLSSLPISPYIGGGIALVEGSKQTNSTGSYDTQKDSASGTWVGVGAYWDITRFFTLGVDMRLSNAEVKIAGEDVSAGGVNAGITAGLHW